MSSHLKALAVTAAVFCIAAGPAFADGKAFRVALWTGLVAAATYLKGRYEDVP